MADGGKPGGRGSAQHQPRGRAVVLEPADRLGKQPLGCWNQQDADEHRNAGAGQHQPEIPGQRIPAARSQPQLDSLGQERPEE